MPPKSRPKAGAAASGRRASKKSLRARETAAQHLSDEHSTSNFELREFPIGLQQRILNVFKSALDRPFVLSKRKNVMEAQGDETAEQPWPQQQEKPLSELVQTVKSHLYNRDFEAAFAGADGELLRAYALRWSAGRALAYASIFGFVFNYMMSVSADAAKNPSSRRHHAVCVGGGAGSEVVALAAAWEMMVNGELRTEELGNALPDVQEEEKGQEGKTQAQSSQDVAAENVKGDRLHVSAVDIADWSSVIDQLATTMSSSVPASHSYRAPLISSANTGFSVDFAHSDVLALSKEELQAMLRKESFGSTPLVTLMFTLNELFSTSIAKTTAFLLRLTEVTVPDTLLLVVDSPGSYSTVALGKKAPTDEEKPKRTYPMKFLLEHALLHVASDRWERVVSEDSKWFRRDAAKLRYSVGDGVGLEDMRFQLHLYRRLRDRGN